MKNKKVAKQAPKTEKRDIVLTPSDAFVCQSSEARARELEQQARATRLGAVMTVLNSHGLDARRVVGEVEVGPKDGAAPKTMSFQYAAEEKKAPPAPASEAPTAPAVQQKE